MDIPTIRFGEWTIPVPHRLTTISSPAGSYTLGYLPDDVTLPSRMNSIQFCPAQQGSVPCFDPITFDWIGGGFSFQQDSNYTLPTGVTPGNGPFGGAIFVDLNGDGRPDIVQSQDVTNTVWENTGPGWTQRQDWALPGPLYDKNHNQEAILADMDGDGLPDWIGMSRELCDVGFSSDNCTTTPIIVYNRLKTNGGWRSDTVLSASFPPTSAFSSSSGAPRTAITRTIWPT